MLARLAPLRVRKLPMIAARKSPRRARWVKPVVLVDAEFRGKTADRLLWHPSFQACVKSMGLSRLSVLVDLAFCKLRERLIRLLLFSKRPFQQFHRLI